MNALYDLAHAVGLQIEWTDASGCDRRVSDDALRTVLTALGHTPDDPNAHERLLQMRRANEARFVSGEVGAPIALPKRFAGRSGVLVLEGGEEYSVRLETPELPPIGQAGYHRVLFGEDVVTVAVAPPRCFMPAEATDGRRCWGPAVQIASLRRGRREPYGDFGTLADAADGWGRAGADLLAISPVHALFPADPSRYSPYAPSSRLFTNVLYADPGTIGEMPQEKQPDGALIDWQTAVPARMAALRAAYARREDAVREAVDAFRRRGGNALEQHARFDALHAHFFARGARGWQDWPTAYRDPTGAAVASFAREHEEEIDFHAFCQWLADAGLARAQASAKGAGMAIGLIADLAVGMDAGGSHAWSRPGDLLHDVSIGAPPDVLGPDGQDWGITGFFPDALQAQGFMPFVETIRAALRHAGGIRIDHALGLARLWIVPHGEPASAGAYLTYPVDHMLRILAIESRRARAIVIGEDLGTVPAGLREKLDMRGMLGMRVLPFERTEAGGLRSPGSWSRHAAAMTSTHDLPTIAGWWSGRDIDWTWALGRNSPHPNEASARAAREHDRRETWRSFVAEGVVDGPEPEAGVTAPAVDAGIAYVARTACDMAIVPIEDLIGSIEQPNIPGTTDEHPNWRRRMPDATAALIAGPDVARRIAAIERERAS